MDAKVHEPARVRWDDGLLVWLTGQAALPLPELHGRFCDELAARGFPLWRSSLGLELLHPEQSGVRAIWTEGEDVKLTPAPPGVENTPDYLNSPVRIIDDTGEPFRRRLSEPSPDIPMLDGFREQGGTDYVIFPLPFLERTRSAYLSFLTREKRGFSDADLAGLQIAANMISPYAERRALRRMSVDLLDTYVGHHAGERIFNGRIRRGTMETIHAAILMCDMRGFTALSNRAERHVVVELLDAWFERIEAAVEANGGEILKFMGDGMLAIFRAEQDAAEASRRAYAAALEMSASLRAGFGADCAACGEMPIGFAVGLHVGEVAYGNVGGRHRLDFTVLGPAVNYASRLQDLAKRLDRELLMSRDIAETLPGEVEELGAHQLRGFEAAEPVYGTRVQENAF